MELTRKDFKVGDRVLVEKNAWRSNPAGLRAIVEKVGSSTLYLTGDETLPYKDADGEFLVYPEEVTLDMEPLADWEKELMTSEEALVALKEKLATPTLRSRILEAAHKLADALEKVDEKHIEQGAVSVGPDPWTRDTVAVTFTVRVSG